MSLMETLEVLQCHCALLRTTTLLQPLITHLRGGEEEMDETIKYFCREGPISNFLFFSLSFPLPSILLPALLHSLPSTLLPTLPSTLLPTVLPSPCPPLLPSFPPAPHSRFPAVLLPTPLLPLPSPHPPSPWFLFSALYSPLSSFLIPAFCLASLPCSFLHPFLLLTLSLDSSFFSHA